MKGYFVQNIEEVIGSRATPATLTTSYTTDGTNDGIIATGRMEELTLYVYYTQGEGETGNTLEVKVSTSDKASNSKTSAYWVPLTDAAAVSSSVSAVTDFDYQFTAAAAAGTYEAFRIRLTLNDPAVWVQVKESAVETNAGSVYVIAVVGGH